MKMESAMSYEDLSSTNHYKAEPSVSFDTGNGQQTTVGEANESQSADQELEVQPELPFYLMRAPPRKTITFIYWSS